MSDQKPLVSLVVPIYNVERYVAECVKSCCKQTMRNIEIICVDDGSTDHSYEIVQKMAQRIRVLNVSPRRMPVTATP